MEAYQYWTVSLTFAGGLQLLNASNLFRSIPGFLSGFTVVSVWVSAGACSGSPELTSCPSLHPHRSPRWLISERHPRMDFHVVCDVFVLSTESGSVCPISPRAGVHARWKSLALFSFATFWCNYSSKMSSVISTPWKTVQDLCLEESATGPGVFIAEMFFITTFVS